MVASDTIVGAVGAFVLALALVGVFVLESEPAVVEKDLAKASFHGKASGTAKRVGKTAAGGDCVPQPLPIPCDPQETRIEGFRIEGLPEVKEPASLQMWMARPGGHDSPKGMKFAGNAYTVDTFTTGSAQVEYTSLFVTYEATTNPQRPSSLKVYEKTPLALGMGNAETSLQGEFDVGFAAPEAKATATLADADGHVDATIHLEKAANLTGFKYSAWLVKADGKMTFLGDFGNVGATISGEAHTLADAKVADFRSALITLEPDVTSANLEGWPVFSVELVKPVEPAPK